MNCEFWSTSDVRLKSVQIKKQGTIEDNENTLMVDFANMYIGGGWMDIGWVQEEILFLIFPELIFSIILFPWMKSNEAIVITGAKRYSNYEGYDWTLKFKSSHVDSQPLDSLKRIHRVITAIDATFLWGYESQIAQFTPPLVFRELNKAAIGFIGDKQELVVNKSKLKVSTGRWGWGVFHGNAELKFLLQWIATSINSREMDFFTFNSEDCSGVDQLYNIFKGKKIKDLISEILLFGDFVTEKIKTCSDEEARFMIDNWELSILSYLKDKMFNQ